MSSLACRVVGHCRRCRELDNMARAREDYTLYRAMLRDIRKSEEAYKDDSHIIFLIQVRGVLPTVLRELYRGYFSVHNTALPPPPPPPPSPPPLSPLSPQEPDLRYLIENIWGAQSILSAAKDVYDLTLPRWDRREQWSPWNCILITKDEARGHNSLESVEEVLSLSVPPSLLPSNLSKCLDHTRTLAGYLTIT